MECKKTAIGKSCNELNGYILMMSFAAFQVKCYDVWPGS
jgi:hypothetical protein